VALAERRHGPIPRRVSPDYIWGEAQAALGEADVRLANLETAVCAAGTPWPAKGIHYRMHPANVACLAPLDVVALANNHVLDWGGEGLTETLAALDGAGIRHCGAGLDPAAARRPAVLTNRHGRLLVLGRAAHSSGVPPAWAASADRPGIAVFDPADWGSFAEIAETVDAHRRRHDLVVASLHWGGNWGYRIPPEHRRFARRLVIEGSVDVVFGHSSHHPLGIEVCEGKPILYGCGDLVNDYEGIAGHEEYLPDLGLVYRAVFTDGALTRLEASPWQRHRFRLRRPPPKAVEALGAILERQCARLGTGLRQVDDGYSFSW
jgi:poly-gamma-glutamate synthesis protein (capsule biosynthesis protein)